MIFLFSDFQRKPPTWISARMKRCYDQSPRLSFGPKNSSPKWEPLSSPHHRGLWAAPPLSETETSQICCTWGRLSNDRSWPDAPIPQPITENIQRKLKWEFYYFHREFFSGTLYRLFRSVCMQECICHSKCEKCCSPGVLDTLDL